MEKTTIPAANGPLTNRKQSGKYSAALIHRKPPGKPLAGAKILCYPYKAALDAKAIGGTSHVSGKEFSGTLARVEKDLIR